MTVVFRYAARSHAGLGRGRDLNEDSGYAGPRLLAVADGMGGHVAGEVASALTITAIRELDTAPAQQQPDPLGALARAVRVANARIADWIKANPNAKGMGTTLTALLMHGDRQLGLVHIGDCRAYLLRRGAMRRISRDHTLLQSLIDEGKLTREQAEVHPHRAMITKAMQGNDDDKARPDVYTEQVEFGDRILVCSDGLVDAPVTEHVIANTLEEYGNVDQAAAALVELALRAGGPDNVTCVVADVVNVKSKRRAPSTTPITVGAAAVPNLLYATQHYQVPPGQAPYQGTPTMAGPAPQGPQAPAPQAPAQGPGQVPPHQAPPPPQAPAYPPPPPEAQPYPAPPPGQAFQGPPHGPVPQGPGPHGPAQQGPVQQGSGLQGPVQQAATPTPPGQVPPHQALPPQAPAYPPPPAEAQPYPVPGQAPSGPSFQAAPQPPAPRPSAYSAQDASPPGPNSQPSAYPGPDAPGPAPRTPPAYAAAPPPPSHQDVSQMPETTQPGQTYAGLSGPPSPPAEADEPQAQPQPYPQPRQ